VRGEIDNKFELLVVNGSNPKDIQIVSLWKSTFLKIIVLGIFQLELIVHFFGCN